MHLIFFITPTPLSRRSPLPDPALGFLLGLPPLRASVVGVVEKLAAAAAAHEAPSPRTTTPPPPSWQIRRRRAHRIRSSALVVASLSHENTHLRKDRGLFRIIRLLLLDRNHAPLQIQESPVQHCVAALGAVCRYFIDVLNE